MNEGKSHRRFYSLCDEMPAELAEHADVIRSSRYDQIARKVRALSRRTREEARKVQGICGSHVAAGRLASRSSHALESAGGASAKLARHFRNDVSENATACSRRASS